MRPAEANASSQDSTPQTSGRQIPWLADEHFEVAIDAGAGALTSPPQRGDALIVTNERAIKVGSSTGAHTTTLVPLSNLTAVEVLTVSRPSERLGQGMLLLVVGAALGLISWSVIGVPFVSLLLGGLPVLVAVYVLAGWAFPDGEGELRLYAQGHVITQPLRSSNAKRDSHLVAQRLYELMTGTSVPAAAPDSGPAAADEPTTRRRPSLRRRAGAASREPTSARRQKSRPWSPLKQRHGLPRLKQRHALPRPKASPPKTARSHRLSPRALRSRS